jgi:hypothetical protein
MYVNVNVIVIVNGNVNVNERWFISLTKEGDEGKAPIEIPRQFEGCIS